MTHIIAKTIDLNKEQKRLSKEKLMTYGLSLKDNLFPIFASYFPNISKDYFANHQLMLNDNRLLMRKILLLSDKKSEKIVGFATIKAELIKIDNKKYGVLSGGAYVKNAFQKKGFISSFYFKEIIPFLCTNYFKLSPVIFSICGPSTYHMLCKYSKEIYPSHNGQPPTNINRLFNSLKKRLGYKTDASRPFIILSGDSFRRSKSVTNDSDWKLRKEIHNKYFWHICPDYSEGKAVISIVPLTLENIFFATKKKFFENFF